MVQYKKLYAILCKAASDALEALPNSEKTQESAILLQEALWQAEDLYLKDTQGAVIYSFEAAKAAISAPAVNGIQGCRKN